MLPVVALLGMGSVVVFVGGGLAVVSRLGSGGLLVEVAVVGLPRVIEDVVLLRHVCSAGVRALGVLDRKAFPVGW